MKLCRPYFGCEQGIRLEAYTLSGQSPRITEASLSPLAGSQYQATYHRGTDLQPDVGLMGKIHRQMLTHFPMVTQILASSQNGIGGYPRYPILSYAAPTWLARM